MELCRLHWAQEVEGRRGGGPPGQRPHEGLGCPCATPGVPRARGPLARKPSAMPSAAAPPRAAHRAAVAALESGGGGGDADREGDAEPSVSRSDILSSIIPITSLGRHLPGTWSPARALQGGPSRAAPSVRQAEPCSGPKGGASSWAALQALYFSS